MGDLRSAARRVVGSRVSRTSKPRAPCSSRRRRYSGSGTLAAPETVIFNHGLGEIFTALTASGLTVTALEEHREVHWNPLGDAMKPSPDFEGEWVLAERVDRMPLSYTLQAVKR